MTRFPELLRRLFRYYGFEDGPGEGMDIRLRKGSLVVELVMVEGAAETDEGTLERLLARETNADRIIVASLGRFTEQARFWALKRKVQLWDRAHLEEEVGRVVMGEVDSRQAVPVTDSILEPFLDGKMADIGPEDAENPNVRSQSESFGAQDAVEGPKTRPGDTAAGTKPEIPGGEAMVQPQISLERARELVKDRLQNAFRLDMQLLPHHVFSYSLEIDGPGGSKLGRTGGVLVNAVSGEASEWHPGMALEKPDAARIRIEPSLERPAACEKALELVMSRNTRVVNFKREKRSVTVYEKRTIRPKDDAVVFEYKGILYIPVWCIEAPEGAAVLDAVTGRVVKEEMFSARAATLGKDRDK